MTAIDTKAKRWRWPDWPEGLTEDQDGVYSLRGEVTRIVIDACLTALPPVEAPNLVFDIAFAQSVDLSDPAMAGIVATAWAASEQPTRALCRAEWVNLLRQNGYSIDGRAADRPTESVRVFRGCVREILHLDTEGKVIEFDALGRQVDPDQEMCEVRDSRLGLSWTTDLFTARRYAVRGVGETRRVGAVYASEIAPADLLARIGDEYLVDPIALGANGLNIRVLEVALDG